MELDGALIYVTGNLTVTGNITGDGALIALGDVKLTGQSTIEADSKVAVISKGDLTLTGTGSERSLFSGLVYSEGKVEASRITVVGGIVANNPSDPESASMEVSETKLVNFAEKTKFDLSSEITGPKVEDVKGPLLDTLDSLRLGGHQLDLIYPDIPPLLRDDGTWDTTRPPVFKFSYVDPTTKIASIYDSADEIPNIGPFDKVELRNGLSNFRTYWEQNFLSDLRTQNSQMSVFQLDPNQLLTVSSGFKVLLKRPL